MDRRTLTVAGLVLLSLGLAHCVVAGGQIFLREDKDLIRWEVTPADARGVAPFGDLVAWPGVWEGAPVREDEEHVLLRCTFIEMDRSVLETVVDVGTLQALQVRPGDITGTPLTFDVQLEVKYGTSEWWRRLYRDRTVIWTGRLAAGDSGRPPVVESDRIPPIQVLVGSSDGVRGVVPRVTEPSSARQ